MTHSTEHWFTFESDARESRKALLLQGASVSPIAYDAHRELYVFDEYESRDMGAHVSYHLATSPLPEYT